MNLPSIEVEIDQTAADIARDYRLDRRSGVVEAFVDCHLAAFRRNALVKVSLRIDVPDTDQGKTEIAASLQ